ncbi:hypothetical protein M885DRAFT_620276 [Pelagophyceae sp. CCMP2097]|nr:hypothetical protein M885DRAFT_620276 [Pelagophyceae sp. CCMP2097]
MDGARATRVELVYEAGFEPLRELQLAPFDDAVDAGARLTGVVQDCDTAPHVAHAVRRLQTGARLETVNGQDVSTLGFGKILKLLHSTGRQALVFSSCEQQAPGGAVSFFRNFEVGFDDAEEEEDDDDASTDEDGFGEGTAGGRASPGDDAARRTRDVSKVLRGASSAAPAAPETQRPAAAGDAAPSSSAAVRFAAVLERHSAEVAGLTAEVESLRGANAGLRRVADAAEAESVAAAADAARWRSAAAHGRVSAAAVDDAKVLSIAERNAGQKRLASAARDLEAAVRQWHRAEQRATIAESALAGARAEAAELRDRALAPRAPQSFFATSTRPRREADLERLCHSLLRGNTDRDTELAALRAALREANGEAPPRGKGKRSTSCAPLAASAL